MYLTPVMRAKTSYGMKRMLDTKGITVEVANTVKHTNTQSHIHTYRYFRQIERSSTSIRYAKLLKRT